MAKKSLRSRASRSSSKTVNTMKVQHVLVPEHVKISEKEKDEILKNFNITIKELPKIFSDDPAIRHLGVKENDVIKVIRNSPTGGKSVFYRGVINE